MVSFGGWERAYWFEKTGHKDISVGDFGNWYCFSCKRGGEWEPEAVKCEKLEPEYMI